MAFNSKYRGPPVQRNSNRNRNHQQPQFFAEPPRLVLQSGYGYATEVVNSQPHYSEKPQLKEPELSSLLECPVCFSIPEKEIFNCEKGHSVCGTCRVKLARCALCAGPFKDSRNFVVESLVSHFKKFGIPLEGKKPAVTVNENALIVNCRNKWQGCKKALLNSEIARHEKECEYRPVRCKVTSEPKCPWDTYLNLSEYMGHLINQHKINGIVEPSGYFTKIDRLFMGLEINTSWPPFYLSYDGETFLRFASLRNRKVSWWIQLIGPDSDSRKYRAVISMHSPNKPDTKISWSVPVYSIRDSKSTIDETNIATISAGQIEPFCSMEEAFENRVATHVWICNIALHRVN